MIRLSPFQRPIKKLKAAILDFSGTTVDAYVIAPTIAFVKVFEKYGVPISLEEARKPMGLRKDLHIQEIINNPSVRERWYQKYRRHPRQSDINNIFNDFIPLQLDCIREYGTLLPGVKKSVDFLRNENMKIGITTGFTSSMTKILLEETSKQGFTPDSCVAGDEVINNLGFRPSPFMIYTNLLNMGVYPISSVVKVDDTVSGIGEGLNAGCWTVGVYGYSNYMNINSLDDIKKISKKELLEKKEISKKILSGSGAHYIIESMEKFPNVIMSINSRLMDGETPFSEI